jgi:Fe-S cluster biogenesis protein NfuA/nitrite reductase/ring-hydroxylating ferredoxin subunit
MLVHGLHPHGVERRIEDALDSVRPYLGSHGGDVALLEVVERQDGPVVRLQFAGSCKSCPSSAVTLEFAVEDAVRAAAPEIVSIEVVAAQPDSPESPSLISVDSVLSRLRDHNDRAGATWHPVPDIGDLGQGEIAGFLVAGVPILACRVADDVFAYHDRCGRCHESLAGATLHRPLGAAIGQAVLRCPRCHAHFDVVHAGVGVDDTAETAEHLDPIPLLRRDGVPSVSVIAEASGVM